MIKKIIKKVKSGMLREIATELKWIYGYGKRYVGAIFWYIFLGVFGTAMGLGAGILSKEIIDGVTSRNLKGLVPAAVLFVLLQLFRIGTNAWTNRISAKINIRVDQEIRADVYDKIMSADWEAMSEYHSGDLLNRVDNDVSSVSSGVLGWIPEFITEMFQFVGTLAVILYYDPTLAGLALLSAPATVLISRMLLGRMRNYNKKMREVSSEVMSFNEESFHNIQVIKSFGLTDFYGQKLREVQKNYREVQLDYNKFSIITSAFMMVVATVASIACYGWGVYRLWGGYITFGTMMLFLQLSASLSQNFSALVSLIPSAVSAATAAGRLMSLTELPKESRADDEAAQTLLDRNKENGISLEAKNLSFSYKTRKDVFINANFFAKPGEIVALIGPSGEGKTTMLRILLGIVNPCGGSLKLYGTNTRDGLKVSASTRRLFSYVPQENTMFCGTVAENLRIMKQDATDEELNRVLKLACAYDFVHKKSNGLNTRIKEHGGGFSEGQLQRLSIARALLSDAPILLFDEATSALDVATERRVLRNIMKTDVRKTCIVTTHRPSVLGVCNRVYRISNGHIDDVNKEEIQQIMMDF